MTSESNSSIIPAFVDRMHDCSYCPQQEHLIVDSFTTLSYRSDNLAAYLHEIACSVSQFIQSNWTIVTLGDGETGNVIASSLDLEDKNSSFSVHGTLAGEVAQTGKPIWVKDIRQSHHQYKLPDRYLAYLGVPLQSPFGNQIGTICSFFEQPHSFSEEMVQRVKIFAERAAIALDNYQLYQQQQQLLNELRQTNQQLQKEIQERQQVEQEVMRLAEIGELAAMIVHEVRNPLTTILLGLMALKKSDLTEAVQMRLALALEEADRLQRLLNEILLYTKRPSLQCSELEVNRWMREMRERVASIPVAAGRHIEITSSVPEAWISGDPDKLKQVFVNLMKNACEAATEGSVITWSATPGKTSNHVCICCHNEGEPIPPELLEKLGTPFCTTKPEGNGLGLAIVQRIIEAHQGEFTIQSGSNTGTEVCIHLPFIQPQKS
ncbi:MAG: ATP-binding protein [Leptolyngbyaceae cyanobacterium bins.302]|nr:ATP-binding protein [Leptolyngbyaceae cyanobacterium bins.302]